MKKFMFIAATMLLGMCQCVSSQSKNDGVLSYENFLEIYESMAKSGDDNHFPSNEIINKYGLIKKEYTDGDKYTVIGVNIDISNNEVHQTSTDAWWIRYEESDGLHIQLYLDKDQYAQFKKEAFGYGLVSALVGPENDWDQSHDLIFAAKNPDKGKVTQIRIQKECKEKQVIGELTFTDEYSNVQLGFDNMEVIPETYLNDLISFDDILKTNCDFESLTKTHGFKHKEIYEEGAQFSVEYFYKNCIVSDNGEVKPTVNGTPICVISDGHHNYASYTIKLFDPVAQKQMELGLFKHTEYVTSDDKWVEFTQASAWKFKWPNGTIGYADYSEDGMIVINVPFDW